MAVDLSETGPTLKGKLNQRLRTHTCRRKFEGARQSSGPKFVTKNREALLWLSW